MDSENFGYKLQLLFIFAIWNFCLECQMFFCTFRTKWNVDALQVVEIASLYTRSEMYKKLQRETQIPYII